MWALGILILEIIQGYPLSIVPEKKVTFGTNESIGYSTPGGQNSKTHSPKGDLQFEFESLENP